MVKLYSTHCPKCKVIEMKLAQKNIEFDIEDDTDKVVAFGTEHGIANAPILDTGEEILEFAAINKWINQQ